MAPPLPKELRDRFVRLIGTGLAGREAARRLQLSAATGGRWARQTRRAEIVSADSRGDEAVACKDGLAPVTVNYNDTTKCVYMNQQREVQFIPDRLKRFAKSCVAGFRETLSVSHRAPC